jgi:TatD DNase family protein
MTSRPEPDEPPVVGGWIDSHCHVQTATDGTEAVIARARAAGVSGMVVVGTDLASSRAAVDVAARHPDVRATVGLHPHDASAHPDQWGELVALAETADVVAIGETGFDFHYRHSGTEDQEAAFRAQIRLAHRLGRALVIHTREAWDDTWRVLDDEGFPERTVLHCFTGGPAEAERALAAGAFLSFSGIVSFSSADDVRAAAARCPPERRLLETDAPFLAPVPYRGRENEPAFVSAVGAALAAATGETLEEVARSSAAAAERVFGSFS